LEPIEEKKRKVFTISASLLLRAKRNSFFMRACCKELFMITQLVWWKLRAVHHEKYPTMNFFEAVEKVLRLQE
jgi:hypothetical protein